MELLKRGQRLRNSIQLASWHQDDSGPALRAIARAEGAAPHLRLLSAFLLTRMPKAMLASSSIKDEGQTACSRVIRLQEAVGHSWISFNTSEWTNCETIDIDEPIGWRGLLADAVAAGLPAPAFAVFSPFKGTVHLTWVYDRPIRVADPKQNRIRRGIRRGLRMLFDADPRFSNRLTKNPWHVGRAVADPASSCGDLDVWTAYQATGSALTHHTEVMDLRAVTALELLRPLMQVATKRKITLLAAKPALPGEPRLVKTPSAQADPKGSRLFHAAARAVRRACTGRADVILSIVQRTATALRSPAGPGELATIAANITRWMNESWRGPLNGQPGKLSAVGRLSIDHGAMTGEAADAGPEALDTWRKLDVTGKRQVAGPRSRAIVAAKNDEAIRNAIFRLLEAGAKVTRATVAVGSGVSIETVKRRWKTLEVGEPIERKKGSHGLIRPCGAESLVPVLTPARLAKDAREAQRRDKSALVAYAGQAARMLRPGAEVEAVFPPCPNASPVLKEAHVKALAAQAVAWRRAGDRRKRAASKVRAVEREAWHDEHAGDEPSWQARLAELAWREIATTERALHQGGTALDRVEMAFSSIRAAEDRARMRASGIPVKPRQRTPMTNMHAFDGIDAAIPW